MTVTNLLTNMIMVTSSGTIAVNTPVYRDFAIHEMLTNAQLIAARLEWNTNLITSDKMTASFVAPNPSKGFRGWIEFGSYHFSFAPGGFQDCFDREYSPSLSGADFNENKPDKIQNYLSHDQLNRETAKCIAYSNLFALGISQKVLESATLVQRQEIELIEGDSRYLPFYEFVWTLVSTNTSPEKKLKRNPGLNNKGFKLIISGITKKVLKFEDSTGSFQMPSPSNFFQLLNLPTNTIFVKKMLSADGKSYVYKTTP